MKSELNFWFLEDGNLGGNYSTVLKDFAMIITEAAAIGLEVRPDESELFFFGDTLEEQKLVIKDEFQLLSSAIETILFFKSWSDPINESIFDMLVTESDDTNKLRIISAEGKVQAGWNNALPCRSLGLMLTDVHLRISIALRLGLPICEPHTCKCGQPVDNFGTQGLSCRRSAGRNQSHAMINDVTKRALGSANIPSVLEPPGLATSDNKKPDGLT